MSKWNAISIQVAANWQEPVVAILTVAGAIGIAVAERFDDAINSTVDVTGYFPYVIPLTELLININQKLTALKEDINLPDFAISTAAIGADDWAIAWQPYYQPARISHDFTIVPSWDNSYQATGREMVIRLDPGTAFGTGTHPTTKLAIYALEQVMRGGETVIDVGTGSGVLAVAAAHLGAVKVFAFDNDDAAVQIARENIARNGYADQTLISTNNLLSGINVSANIIVANILADVLLLLIDDATALLYPNGYLILSGIFYDKIDEIITVAERAGLSLDTRMSQGDWHCAIFQKPNDIS